MHLTHVVTRTGIAPDIALTEVFDAARASTEKGHMPARTVLSGPLPDPATDVHVRSSSAAICAVEPTSAELAESAQAAQRAASAGQTSSSGS